MIIIILRALNNEEDDVATLDFLRRILPFVDQNRQKEPTEKKKNKEKQKKRNQQNQPKIKYYFYID